MKQLFPAFPAGRTGLALLFLRLIVGAAFIVHGTSKIQHPFTWMGPHTPVPGFLQAAAAVSEYFGGMALIVGLLTPLAAFGLLCTMAVATYTVSQMMKAPWVPAGPGNSFELPLLYFVIALAFLLTGPGAYSLDAQLFNRKKTS